MPRRLSSTDVVQIIGWPDGLAFAELVHSSLAEAVDLLQAFIEAETDR